MKVKKANKKKLIIFLGILAFFLILIIIGTRFYLYVNLLLGKDLTIKLSSDKENLFISHGDSEDVRFKVYPVTNPFCTADCNFVFNDLSSDKIIDQGEFRIKTPSSFSKEYTLTAGRFGKGQDIYRFDLQCMSKKTYLCNTKGISKTRSILITLNYDLNEEEKIKNEILKENIEKIIIEYDKMSVMLERFSDAFDELNKTLPVDYIKDEIEKLKEGTKETSQKALLIKYMWESQDYSTIDDNLNEVKSMLFEHTKKFEDINSTLMNHLSYYNEIVKSLTLIRDKIELFNKMKVPATIMDEINNTINSFSELLKKISDRNYKGSREKLIQDFHLKLDLLSELTNEVSDPGSLNILNRAIEDIILHEIIINYSFLHEKVIFNEIKEICYLYGRQNQCCMEECRNDPSKFPIILLHGHIFNNRISAEHSLDTMNGLQERLEDDGYIKAGSIFFNKESEIEGVWGKTNKPLSVKASYYFDIFSEEWGSVIIQTKEDNIDTYSIRLKNIVDFVKYKTNREKVVIIAHSMGGLVARRYIQVFGDQDVHKIILIGSPNHGIEGDVLEVCSLLGTKKECYDMNKDSLFINKINTNNKIIIPVYNIIGIGCNMDDETGDGIVKNSSAYLKGAENYYVAGDCESSKFRWLHNEILNPSKYPKSYNLIISSIKR